MVVMPATKRFKYIFIILLFTVLSVGLIRSANVVIKGNKRLSDLKEEVKSLQDKKVELEGDIEYKKTNEYIEEKARNDLNLIKPGETIYVISGPAGTEFSKKDATPANKDSGDVQGTRKVRSENWYKWFKLFF